MNRKRCAVVGILWAVSMTTAVGLISLLTPGCAQNQEQPVAQAPSQSAGPSTASREYQKNAGPVINIVGSNIPTVTDDPGEATTGAVQKARATGFSATQPAVSFATPFGPLASAAPIVFYQNQTITINTGDQVPSQTGTVTTTGQATQTASQSPSQEGTQRPESTVQGSVPLGILGGSATAAGSAAGSGGTTGATSQTTTNDLKTALLREAASGDAASRYDLMTFIKALFGLVEPATTQPTTQASP